jgi:hypothetical protein
VRCGGIFGKNGGKIKNGKNVGWNMRVENWAK